MPAVQPGVIAAPGVFPPEDQKDLRDAFPPGNSDRAQLMEKFDVEVSRLRAPDKNFGKFPTMGAQTQIGANQHFYEKTILVKTRASPAPSWADLVTDWDRTVDLAAIITAVSVEYEVFNSHTSIDPDEPQNVLSVNASDPSGITIVNTPPVPTVLSEYENLLTEITVSPEGSPTLNTVITWDISPDGDLAVTITGTRINMFGFMPQRGVQEILGFQTDIFRARSGAEQRASVRPRPTVEYEFRYRLDDPEREAALNKLIGSGDRLFSVPVWFELEPLSADLSIGATTIPVDTRFADYRDTGFGLVILWRDWNDFEVATISAVTDFELTLTRPLEQNHAAEVTLVMPTIASYLPNQIAIDRYRTLLADYPIRWRSIQSTDLERMLATPAPPTYQSLPLIADPNYMSGTTLAEPMTQGFDSLDSGGGGNIRRFRPADIPLVGSRKTWFTQGAEDRWNLRGLMHQLAGRRKAFYLPTFATDFVPTNGIASASTALEYSPNEYTEQIADADPRRDIEVLLTDGTILRRRILASTDDGETFASLTVDSAWGVNATIDEIVRVSLLTKVRLDADELRLEHTDTTETTLSAPVVEVKD